MSGKSRDVTPTNVSQVPKTQATHLQLQYEQARQHYYFAEYCAASTGVLGARCSVT